MPNMKEIARQIDSLQLDSDKSNAVDRIVEEITGQKINRLQIKTLGIYKYDQWASRPNRILIKHPKNNLFSILEIGTGEAAAPHMVDVTEAEALSYMKNLGYVYVGQLE